MLRGWTVPSLEMKRISYLLRLGSNDSRKDMKCASFPNLALSNFLKFFAFSNKRPNKFWTDQLKITVKHLNFELCASHFKFVQKCTPRPGF